MEYIDKILKKTGWLSIAESIIFAIIGIVLIKNPEETVKVITYILGIIFILIGIYKIFQYESAKGKDDLYNYGLVYGAMAIIIGLITIAFSNTIGSLFRIIVGIWIIYSALLRMSSAIKLRKLEDSKLWIATLTLAILMLICGLYVIANSGTIIATIGVFILIYSIIDIIENTIFLKNVKLLNNK